MIGPAEDSGLEEGAIHDQLPAAFEQVEQADLTLGSFELVIPVHQHPRHAPALRRQSITGVGEGLLLNEETLPSGLPLLLRDDFRISGCFGRCLDCFFHRNWSFPWS